MPLIQSCCCWHSLRKGCYASAIYTFIYFTVTVITMGHFIEVEQRYLTGQMANPQSESFLAPDKITTVTVSLNITLLACSCMGLISCLMLIIGVYKDIKALLLPWIACMCMETCVEIVNVGYLFYLQTAKKNKLLLTKLKDVLKKFRKPLDSKGAELSKAKTEFNPITSFLFTLDLFIIILNLYAVVCVISQFQEYMQGRGTAAFDYPDRNTVQYTATAQHTTTTSSAPSGRRRSGGRPMVSRCDLEEVSEAPTKVITSVLSKPGRGAVKKHVQFPDDASHVEQGVTSDNFESAGPRTPTHQISSLWADIESETEVPER